MDLGFVSDFFAGANEFLQAAWDYIYSGVYDFVKEVMVLLTKVAIYGYVQSTLFAVDIAYEVVQDIFVDLNIASRVESAYSSIPGQIRNALSFFGIPEALTIIFSAIPTRIAMKFIPLIGR